MELPTAPETAALMMTDTHFGKKTATFSPDVFRERMGRLARALAVEREKRPTVAGLRLLMLGDMNDGTDIYATQSHHQANTNVESQAWELSDFMAEWIAEQAKVWGSVEADGVPGNHGRLGKYAHEAANWDLVFYRYLQSKLTGQGIPVRFRSDGDPFISKVGIRRWSYVLYHGHDIKSFGNIPWYGMLLRLSRWSTTNLAPFDVACMGHFHTLGYWQINRIKMLTSGSAVTDDDWALRTLGWQSSPKWWLFGVSDEKPVSWSVEMDLE